MISYAFSTLDLAEEFNDGIEALHKEMPLVCARTYLLTGEKDPRFDERLYARVRELQAIRKKGIAGEMKYARRQAGAYLEMHPEIKLTVEEFIGEDVLSGDCLAPGLGLERKKIAPNLEVYEIFMWYGEQELKDLLGQHLRGNDEWVELSVDGFTLNIWDGKERKVLHEVKGSGTRLSLPNGITEIEGIDLDYLAPGHRCVTFDAPNLKVIVIPASVTVIGPAAFDEFGSELEIFCAAPEKPEGFFEGTYYEMFEEDYEFHRGTGYEGSWLTAGTLREIPKRPEELPVVHWGREFP